MSYSENSGEDIAPDGGEIDSKTMECLLHTQQSYLDCQLLLLEQIRISATLQEEKAHHNEWELERRKYRLHEVSTCAVVMTPNSPADGPAHYLCPNCFWGKQIKSFLCAGHPDNPFRDCVHCSARFWFGLVKPEGGQP